MANPYRNARTDPLATGDMRAIAFMYFLCPKCKVRHKYGHSKEYVDCFRCGYTFSPDIESYRLEKDRISNLPIDQQREARANQRPHPRALARQKKQRHKRAIKKLAALHAALPWWVKIYRKLFIK